MGDVVFLVTIRDTRGRPEALSILRISTLSSESGLLSLMQKVSTKLTSKKAFVKGNCRRDRGDFGGMMVIGQASKQSTNESRISDAAMKGYPGLSRILPKINSGIRNFAENTYPGLISCIKHIDENSGVQPPGMVGGSNGSTSSAMIMSVDLMNATHYDVSDASMSFTVWTETCPDSTKDWYFVLPNILVRMKGDSRTYMGLSLLLFHGLSILWDGRVFWHGTSYHTLKQGEHTVGWFWGANSRTIKAVVNENRKEHGISEEQQYSLNC